MTKILYIGGWGRSGSTILDNVLGQVDGFFSVGELRAVWDDNVLENRLCGCGEPFDRCQLWTEILQRAYPGADLHSLARQVIALRDRTARTRQVPLQALPAIGQATRDRLKPLAKLLDPLYSSIAASTGARVIVDSSKSPSYASLLSQLQGAELYLVHLVRDPRAVAFSWTRVRKQHDRAGDQFMPRYSAAKSTAVWTTWNALLTRLGNLHPERYLRIRYEDFVAAPKSILEQVVRLVDEAGAELPFASPTEVVLRPNHTVSGNPSRFKTGAVRISADQEWRESMRPVDRLTASILSWPLRRKYGY